MPQRIQTGRAIVPFRYDSHTTGKSYRSIILTLEKASGKYGLPGGKVNPQKDRDTLDAAIRELEQELGLHASRRSAQKVLTYHGQVCDHDIYVVDDVEGKLHADHSELSGIGFFNCGRHNEIDESRLESYVLELKRAYFNTPFEKFPGSRIFIPRHYFKGNRQVLGWYHQRKKS